MPDGYVRALVDRIYPLLDHAFVRREEKLRVTVKNEDAEFEPEQGVETVDEAHRALSENVRNWESSAALERGPDTIKLRYRKARLKEENLVPGKASLRSDRHPPGVHIGPDWAFVLTRIAIRPLLTLSQGQRAVV